jgi:hypothetical protein
MTVELGVPSMTYMEYLVRSYEGGKAIGVPQYFSSMGEIKYYLSDNSGRMPTLTIVKSKERIEDRKGLNGMVVEERRFRRTPVDSNPQGTRVYE